MHPGHLLFCVVALLCQVVAGNYNIAFGKPISGNFTLGRIQRVVDGLLDDSNTEIPSFPSSTCADRAVVTLDLGALSTLTSVVIWHKYSDGRQYCGQKLALSNSPAFAGEETVIFDHGSSYGSVESAAGVVHSISSLQGRYLRHWVAKSSASNSADLVEIKVYGTTEQPGSIDLAARFADSTTFITAPSQAGVSGATNFTASMWVRVNRQTLGDRMNIFQQREFGCIDGLYMIFITSDERVEVFGYQISPTSVVFTLTSNDVDVVDGTWHHVALVQTANTTSGGGFLYLDGVLVASHSQGALNVRCAGPFLGLDKGFNKGGLNGYLNEVALWNDRALTTQEVLQLYQKTHTPLTVASTRPSFYYSFDEVSSSGSTVIDSSSNSNHGTISSISGADVCVPVVEATQISDFSMHSFASVNDVDLTGVMKYTVNIGDGAYGTWTSNTSTPGYQIAVQFDDGRFVDQTIPSTFGDDALENVLYSGAHALQTGTFRITVDVQKGAFYKLQGLWMEWMNDRGFGVRVDNEIVAYDFSAYDMTGVSTTRAAAFQYTMWAKSNRIILDLGGTPNLGGYVNTNSSLSGFTLEFLGCSATDYYDPNNSSFPCKPCDVKTGSSDPFATSCSCAPGYTLSQSACIPCGENTYKSVAGNSACSACPSDATSPSGSTSITQCLCPIGVNGSIGMTSCPSPTPSSTVSPSSTPSPTSSASASSSPSPSTSTSPSPSVSPSPSPSYVSPPDDPQICWVGCQDNMRTHARSLKTQRQLDKLKSTVSELTVTTNSTTVQMQFTSVASTIQQLQTQIEQQQALIQQQLQLLQTLNATVTTGATQISFLQQLSLKLNSTAASCSC